MDMRRIFENERRDSGPIPPYPGGTGRFCAGVPRSASSRKAGGGPTPRRLPLLAALDLAQNRARQNHDLNVDWP
jgi:hypothetical protein